MWRLSWQFVSRAGAWAGALALSTAMLPSALGQCGLSTPAVRPAGWHAAYAGSSGMLVRAALDEDNDEAPSIVGMWHVIFTAHTMNGQQIPHPGAVIDNALVVWHPDRTEIMNSMRPPQDGNFCLGVWKQTGERTYYLNHFPWYANAYPNTTNNGIGSPTGPTHLTERATLNAQGDRYDGTFVLTAYNTDFTVSAVFTGTISAKRITTSTTMNDLR